MSTMSPSGDGGSPLSAAPVTALGDEDALKRLFLANYAPLTADAQADLGSDAAVLAPKIVEGAFVRAWDARSKLRTVEELQAFLHEDVHHAAARALSRRAAAHRLGGAGSHSAHDVAPASVDESWTHIQEALHRAEGHSDKALSELADVSRHEAAHHIAEVGKSRSVWVVIAAGVVLLAALVGLMKFMDRLGADAKIATAVNSTDARVVPTPSGRTGVITLTEGTKVTMAPDTRITIPKDFGPDVRAVKVEGAAKFEVAPGLPKELQVHAPGVVAVAHGTAFVMNVGVDSTVTLVVTEGTVDLRRGEAVTPVAAGQAMVAAPGKSIRPATAGERDDASAWTTGTLAVTDRPLREAIAQLHRWYKFDILAQPKLLDRKVTMRASIDSSMEAIHAVEKSTGLKFGYQGQQMVFMEK